MASVLQRLKERKLVQWALAYLAGAWLVVQALGEFADRWGVSAGFLRTVDVLLFVGFLVVLVLAWFHGERGQQRVSGRELLILAAVLGVAGVALRFTALGAPGIDADLTGADAPAAGEQETALPRIAVLPLESISPDPADAWFATGMHDEIISRLSRISGLSVISRSSVLQYRDARPATPEIAATLRAGFIVEGSARKMGDRVRVTVQLIDAGSDSGLWGEEYDRDLTVDDLYAIQQDVAERISGALSVELLPEEEEALSASGTDDLAAYQAYLEGLTHLDIGVGPGRLEEAARYLALATEADPDFAEAWAAMARARTFGHFFGRDDSWLEEARHALDRAVELAPDATGTRLALGAAAYQLDRNLDEAIQHLLGVVRDEPSNADAWFLIGAIQRRQNRWDDALAAMERAFDLDPRNYIVAFSLGQSYGRTGDWNRAREVLDEAVAMEPLTWDAHEELKNLALKSSADTAAAQRIMDAFQGTKTRFFFQHTRGLALYRRQYDLALTIAGDEFPGKTGGEATGHAMTLFLMGDRSSAAEIGRSIANEALARLEGLDQTTPWRNGAADYATAALGFALAGDPARALENMNRRLEAEPVPLDALNGIWGH